MESIKVILVDDELDSLVAIEEQIKMYCEHVEILDTFDDSELALEAIIKQKPDVAFLDIHMPKKNGLEVARELAKYKIKVVFITAHENFAIDAFRLSAVHYILKPLEDGKDLQEVFKRIRTEFTNQLPILDALLENNNKETYSQETKISLSDAERVCYFKINEIIRLKADGNNCHFYFTKNRRMLMTKNMKTFYEPLKDYGLVKVNRSEVINIEHQKEIVKKNGPYIVLSDESKVYIGEKYRKDLPYYKSKNSFFPFLNYFKIIPFLLFTCLNY